MSTAVAIAVRPFASSTPTGGQGLVLARSVNHPAKSPLKNISSDDSHTTTPIARGVGRLRTSSAPATAAMTLGLPQGSRVARFRTDGGAFVHRRGDGVDVRCRRRTRGRDGGGALRAGRAPAPGAWTALGDRANGRVRVGPRGRPPRDAVGSRPLRHGWVRGAHGPAPPARHGGSAAAGTGRPGHTRAAVVVAV